MKVVKNYAGFTGRARRTEYWMFVLFNFLLSLVLSLVEWITDLSPVLTVLYCLFILIPSLAVGVRRLHDSGKSGWWLLISLVPLVGSIVLLVFMCLDSEGGENQYGPNPKVS